MRTIVTYEQETEPTSHAVGETWIDPRDTRRSLGVWDGDQWLFGGTSPNQVGLVIGSYRYSADAGGTDSYDILTISTTGDATLGASLTKSHSDLSACVNGKNDICVYSTGRGGAPGNGIYYMRVSTTAASLSFGEMAQSTTIYCMSMASNGTNDRAIQTHGATAGKTDYFTISTPSNASWFGDCIEAADGYGSWAASNGTNDRMMNGRWELHITNMSTLSNSVATGGLNPPLHLDRPASNDHDGRMVFARGTQLRYINVDSLGDATNFGNAVASGNFANNSAMSNGADGRMIMAAHGNINQTGDNVIDFLSISNLSDAASFGQLTTPRSGSAGASNSQL